MKVEVLGGTLNDKEIENYVSYVTEKYPDRVLSTLNINLDGEYVDLSYTFEAPKFDRIRRITGYLVGTVDRFNNAKRAEVRDRTKHENFVEAN